MRPWRRFFLILVLCLAAAVISLPKNLSFEVGRFGISKIIVSSPEIKIGSGRRGFARDLEIKKGLDIQGGTQLVFRADLEGIPPSEQDSAVESVSEVIRRRIDLYGVSEPVVQTSKVGEESRVLVELAGVTDVNSAIALIGQTAKLDFRELPEDEKEATQTTVSIFSFVETGLTGADLTKAAVGFGDSSATGEPVVTLTFTPEGKAKFAEITKRNIGKQVAIFVDGFPVTAPVVQTEITDGQAIISGSFTIESAKELAIQLNGGALPVPIEVIEQRTVGPSLGQESIEKSIYAGLIGLLVVMTFMVAIYGKMGVIANVALVIYGLITLSIYKLVPVTLTLPGIAGFILSVGMAVDANILIFERMREEMRQDRDWRVAMELGFGRAWDSIKDANFATILTALILFNPLNLQWLVTSGMVRGFALTLLIGVTVSMFTGVVVTRTLMRMFYKQTSKV
jgi:preprotein translocase subunit SecD